jgi:hypothetical protein
MKEAEERASSQRLRQKRRGHALLADGRRRDRSADLQPGDWWRRARDRLGSVRGAGTRLYRTRLHPARPYPARPYPARLYHRVGMQPGGLDRVLYIQIAWLAEACSPPPPRAPISYYCITRKEYNSTLLFAGGLPSQEDRSFQKTQSSGRGTAWVSALGTVAGQSAPGPAGGFPGPGQALRRPLRPGQARRGL